MTPFQAVGEHCTRHDKLPLLAGRRALHAPHVPSVWRVMRTKRRAFSVLRSSCSVLRSSCSVLRTTDGNVMRESATCQMRSACAKRVSLFSLANRRSKGIGR